MSSLSLIWVMEGGVGAVFTPTKRGRPFNGFDSLPVTNRVFQNQTRHIT